MEPSMEQFSQEIIVAIKNVEKARTKQIVVLIAVVQKAKDAQRTNVLNSNFLGGYYGFYWDWQ